MFTIHSPDTAMNEKMDDDNLGEIERILGYHFFERQHLIRALTHSAYANELLQRENTRCMDQEAYSTLGDAVLKTSLILFLMERGLNTKGEITRAKEALESNVSLARIGVRLKIRKYIPAEVMGQRISGRVGKRRSLQTRLKP